MEGNPDLCCISERDCAHVADTPALCFTSFPPMVFSGERGFSECAAREQEWIQGWINMWVKPREVG